MIGRLNTRPPIASENAKPLQKKMSIILFMIAC